MKKLINDPHDFVDEVVDGLLLAHPDRLRAASETRRALVRADAPVAGQVGIVTGGGSGHLPAFLGYVGKGLCSGVAVGNVFSSPSAEQMYEATKAVNGGAGVLYLYGNYVGDSLNFDLAADMADLDDIPTRTVRITDDALSAPPERGTERRGVAGMVFAFKIAGAAAERGDSLEKVSELAQRTVDNTRSAGVGLSPTILPEAGRPTFELADGEMEIGIGIHGEPGSRRGPLETADEVADDLARGHPGRPPARGGRAGRGPRQRPGRHSPGGAVPDLPARPQHPPEQGDRRASPLCRRIRDEPRDGRRVGHGAASRRRADRTARRSG